MSTWSTVPAGKVSGSTNNCPKPGIKSGKGTRSLTAAYGASGGAVNGALSAARVCAETNEKNTAVAKAVAVIDEWIMTFLQFVRAECRTWPIRCKERLFRFSGERAFASVGTTSWFRRPPGAAPIMECTAMHRESGTEFILVTEPS